MMRKIKILYYGLGREGFVGGIETYIRKIVNNIDLNRFQIDFLILGEEKPCFYDELQKKGCKFYYFTARSKNYLKNKREIRAFFNSQDFDLVHCHLNSLSYIEPCIAACKKKIPVIVHSRNGGGTLNFFSRLFHIYHYYRLKFLDVTRIAVSDLAGLWMFGKKSPYVVLNNGIDISKYEFKQCVRESMRQTLNIDCHTEVFINVGSFKTQKNKEFLIQLFSEYVKRKPNSILLLVGDGCLKNEIEKMVERLNIASNVKFLGGRDDVPNLLCAADKFIFPSLYEGFPNAVLEAEASGLKCIVSDVITKEVGICGFCEYVSLKSPIEDWLNAMSVDNDVSLRTLAKMLVLEKHLDVKSEIKRIEELYIKILGNK